MPYTRPQISLLVALVAVFLVGLGVREWRAGYPELAERLERLDREETPAPLPTPPRREPRPARRSEPGPTRASARVEAGPAGAEPAATASGTDAAADPRPLDLNSASVDQIARLPGIGPALARRILAERERRGRFESPEALRGILGLGPKKLAAVKDLITVGN
jgi:competence ComEA-like helix-hairpin-helix protein